MTKFLLTTAVLSILPTLACAQNEDIVVTATRAEQNANQVGQSITEISAATLESMQTVVLADILATTPGVTMARNGGVGGVTSLFIRGADSAQTLVVIDGVRVNDPSSPSGGYDFSTLLAGDIARVEVLRGADSVPWGSAAIGGVVNITTNAPTRSLSAALNAEGGSYGTTDINGHLSDTLGPLAFSLGGGWLHTSGISAFAASEGGKEADGFDQHYANARSEVKLARNISLDFRGHYARSNTKFDGYNTVSGNFGDDAEYGITKEWSGYVGLSANGFNGRLKNRLGYTVSDIRRANYDYVDTNAAYGLTPGLQLGYIGKAQRIEYQGDAQILDAARLVFGVERERSSYTTLTAALTTAGQYHTGVNSLYGQLILTPVSALTLTGGIRYDDHDVYGGKTTFSINGAYRPTPTTTLRASYAEGFKAPTLYQLYGDNGVFTNPNPNLKPETATSYDVGIDQTALNGGVRFTAIYFDRVSKDLIDYQSGIAPTYVGVFFNVGRSRAEGEELSITLKPVRTTAVAVSYTHLKSVDEATNLALARRPNDTISVSADWKAGPVSIGSTLQMVGNSFDNVSNTVIDQSYVLVGLRAAAPITQRLELYGRVDNLFDEQYQVVKHYGTLGRAAYAGLRLKL